MTSKGPHPTHQGSPRNQLKAADLAAREHFETDMLNAASKNDADHGRTFGPEASKSIQETSKVIEAHRTDKSGNFKPPMASAIGDAPAILWKPPQP
jgi:hypothetical protein